MRPIAFAVGVACLTFAYGAVAQDSSLQDKPPPQTQAQGPTPIRPLKPKDAAAQKPPADPAEMEQREQKLLDQKLNSVCRGC